MFPVDVTVFLIETGLDDRSDALDGLDLNLNSETNPKIVRGGLKKSDRAEWYPVSMV